MWNGWNASAPGNNPAQAEFPQGTRSPLSLLQRRQLQQRRAFLCPGPRARQHQDRSRERSLDLERRRPRLRALDLKWTRT